MRSLAILACLAATLQAQETPVIKSVTRQVQVSVVVHDKKGQPIADLTKDDFVLFDKGKEQKISYFALDSGRTPPLTGALAPGVVSNRAAAGNDPLHPSAAATALTVILIDGLNTKFADREYAKQALLQFMSGLRPSDPTVVYALTGQLKMMRAGNVKDATEFLTQFMTESNHVLGFDQRLRVFTTLDALRTITANLSGVPGRKNLVWLTDGFPELSGLTPSGRMGRNFESFSDDVKKTVQAMDSAGIAIYPIDARGMIGTFEWNPSTAPTTNVRGRRAAAVDRMAQNNIVQSEGTMVDVAERTGGRAYMGSNDMSAFIREAVQDTRVSYVLSYAPDHDQWDGRFREIKLKVKRLGVEVRCRKGYFAFPQSEDENSDAARTRALKSALDSPIDSTGVGIMARVMSAPTKENPKTKVAFVVDAKDISFHPEEGAFTVDLDTVLVARDPQGAALHSEKNTLHARFKQDQYDLLLKEGALPLNLELAVPPNSTRLRLAVRDTATGLIGSIDVPLSPTPH